MTKRLDNPSAHLGITALRMNKTLQLVFVFMVVAFFQVSCKTPVAMPNTPGAPVVEAWQTPNIFHRYSRTGNSTLAKSWSRKIDTSGVSFNDVKTITLITPRHVVMAKHYQRPLGSKVVFHDTSGRYLERTLIKVQGAASDVCVGLLDSPVPAAYRSYALPTPSPKHAGLLIGRPVYLTDQNRRIFVHRIAALQGGSIIFRHPPELSAGYLKNLVAGDSGNPSFILHRGESILIETHTTGGPGAGPYYGDAVVQASIRQAVQTLDPSYRIRTVHIY